MLASPLVPCTMAVAALLVASARPANAVVLNLNGVTKIAKQSDHLHLAAHELKHAHTALGGKVGNAHEHLTAAIAHLEHAIKHHTAAHLDLSAGANETVAFILPHHSQLHEALHAAKESQKHLAEGKIHLARSEAEKAHHHVEIAIKEHIGK